MGVEAETCGVRNEAVAMVVLVDQHGDGGCGCGSGGGGEMVKKETKENGREATIPRVTLSLLVLLRKPFLGLGLQIVTTWEQIYRAKRLAFFLCQ